uniref:Ig-like domain-containing protein n=1 Tax=Astyanax mexicanus TaxID=7994 RepID=A0A3B1JI03_ASTMX
LHYLHFFICGNLKYCSMPTPYLIVKPERTAVFIGETVTLTCEIETRENTEWTYSWFKDETAVQPSTNHNVYTFKAKSGDSAAFTCKGTPSTTDSITTEPSNTVSLSVSGECSEERQSGKPDYPSSSSQEYIISSVTDYDRGEYSCSGTVRGTSLESHISSKPKPVLIITPNQLFSGERVTFKCVIQGGGGQINSPYSWYKQGDPVSPYRSSQEYIISSVTGSHSGEYSCSVTVRGISLESQISSAVTLTVFGECDQSL